MGTDCRARRLVLAAALLLAACGGAPELPLEDEAAASARAPLPDGLELPEGSLFSVDATTDRFVIEVRRGGASIEAVLADPDGRRNLLWVEDGREVPLADAGWVLPPAAASATSGDAAVCWSTLIGEPSELTVGALPDPRDGVTLTCRLQRDGVWLPSRPLASTATAAWLVDVVRADDGYDVTWLQDEGLLVHSSTSADGPWTARISGDGAASTPIRARIGDVR
jgi:hypothetical protein